MVCLVFLTRRLRLLVLFRHSERSIIEGENKLDYIEDCIAKQEPWIKVLCLLCMQSLVANGIRASKYDLIRREIVHAYGLEVIFTLDNLESMGFIKKKGTLIRKSDNVTLMNPQMARHRGVQSESRSS